MNIISQLPLFLISLPIVLLALSVHETAHGYVAYKLGDPTANSLGRLTLNPLKHIDPFGLICMVVFHIGWAKPVPINTRYFKNPKRDMAISAAAGPVSNLLLALLFAVLLRLEILLVDTFLFEDLVSIATLLAGAPATISAGIKLLSVLAYMLYMGIILNTSLAIFNLIPIPPFDGSRIAHVFLPAKWYFAIMRYEHIIMIVLLVILWIFPTPWLTAATEWLSSGFLWLLGMKEGTAAGELNTMIFYVYQALAF